MQALLGIQHKPTPGQSVGVRVMLLSNSPEGQAAQWLVDYGSLVETRGDVGHALSGIVNDPIGYDLFVMQCDGLGGVDAAEAAIAALVAAEARLRVILISREFGEPDYPFGRRTAVCLPTAVAEEGFRRGFDHVLRDRAPVTLM